MAIPVQFQQFKAAGIYRVVYDKSTVLNEDSELLRLVVGYSPKGAFNIPVYIKSVADFKAMYGDISKSLENKGCFFHRTAIQALSAGPIICLNLKKFENETVNYAHVKMNDITVASTLVENIYDTTKFWELSAEKLNELDTDSDKHYIHIAATDSKENSASFFMRKATGNKVSAYKITVADWYKTIGKDIPDYLIGHEMNLISDYFAEIYVFSGKFTKENTLASDVLKNFFVASGDNVKLRPYVVDSWGDKKDTLDELLSEPAAGALGHYIGCLIPGFEDVNGAYRALDLVFNADQDIHHLMMSFNSDIIDDEVINLSGIDVLDATTVASAFAGNAKTSVFSNEDSYISASYITSAGNTYQCGSREVVGTDSLNFISYCNYTISENGKVFTSYNNDKLSSFVKIGDKFVSYSGKSACFISNMYNKQNGDNIPDFSADFGASFDASSFTYFIEFTEKPMMKDEYLVRVNDAMNKEIGVMEPTYLEGYEFAGKPTGSSMKEKLNWQKKVLSTISDYKGIHDALLSTAEIDYRYIVDTFESYVDSEIKSTLSLLAKEKELCLAILNFPSVRSFVKCDYASFVNDKNVFNVNYVVDGSNRRKPSSVKFSLPSEMNGASFAAFYTPLKFSDGYIDSILPSAGLVSNLFIEKYSNRFPYSIVAGPNYGNIKYTGMVGPDYHYSMEELQVIEPYGVNCMIFRPKFGTFINANQTAKQTPKSALSSINVRELVIYLQDEIGKVLQAYQWEFNNPVTRKAIKDRADEICEQAKHNGGIQVYKNVMDESNNTSDIIDNEMAVLSTHIEPGRGCGKMIHELTIYRTGHMSAYISEE